MVSDEGMEKIRAIDSSRGGGGGIDWAGLDVPQQSVFFALPGKCCYCFGLDNFI